MAIDVTHGGAVLAGLVSFLSPCVLPLVPPYLCYMAGVSLDQLTGESEERVEPVYVRKATIRAVWRQVKKEGGESVSELVENLLLRWLRDRFAGRPLRAHITRTTWPTLLNPSTYRGMARLMVITAKVATGRRVERRPLSQFDQ